MSLWVWEAASTDAMPLWVWEEWRSLSSQKPPSKCLACAFRPKLHRHLRRQHQVQRVCAAMVSIRPFCFDFIAHPPHNVQCYECFRYWFISGLSVFVCSTFVWLWLCLGRTLFLRKKSTCYFQAANLLSYGRLHDVVSASIAPKDDLLLSLRFFQFSLLTASPSVKVWSDHFATRLEILHCAIRFRDVVRASIVHKNDFLTCLEFSRLSPLTSFPLYRCEVTPFKETWNLRLCQ